MSYTVIHYNNNLTAIVLPFKYGGTTVTYFIDTEDSHFFTSRKIIWKHGSSDSLGLHYHDEHNSCRMFKRLITNASKEEQTCTLNSNKQDLRKKNIIKYPNGMRKIRNRSIEKNRKNLIPYIIDITVLKVISEEFFNTDLFEEDEEISICDEYKLECIRNLKDAGFSF